MTKKMNKNMLAIIATIEGLRNLDNWKPSNAKDALVSLRDSFNTHKEEWQKDFENRFKDHIKYADPLGNPISIFEWDVCIESICTNVGDDSFEIDGKDPIRVSTVWLGMNHSFFGKKIIIFETMVFGIKDEDKLFKDEDKLFDEYQQRYETLAEAEEGHQRALSLVSDYLKVIPK